MPQAVQVVRQRTWTDGIPILPLDSYPPPSTHILPPGYVSNTVFGLAVVKLLHHRGMPGALVTQLNCGFWVIFKKKTGVSRDVGRLMRLTCTSEQVGPAYDQK
jgi:hypothetical protein